MKQRARRNKGDERKLSAQINLCSIFGGVLRRDDNIDRRSMFLRVTSAA